MWQSKKVKVSKLASKMNICLPKSSINRAGAYLCLQFVNFIRGSRLQRTAKSACTLDLFHFEQKWWNEIVAGAADFSHWRNSQIFQRGFKNFDLDFEQQTYEKQRWRRTAREIRFLQFLAFINKISANCSGTGFRHHCTISMTQNCGNSVRFMRRQPTASFGKELPAP